MKSKFKPRIKKEKVKHIPKVEIYFHNLDKETQQALLELYNVKDPRDMNWDVVPIDIIEEPEFEE